MEDNLSLLLLILVPLVGSAVGAFMPSQRSARAWALAVSLVTLLLGIGLAAQMKPFSGVSSGGATVDSTVTVQWGADQASNAFAIEKIGFSLHLGMDTISLWLVLLTVFLQPLVVLSSWESIKDRATEYYAWMSLLLAAMVGVFVARDLLLFYIFFELTLIPMFFIIGIWGGPERRYAAGKFFLFTFTGSVFTLAAALYVGIGAGTFDLAEVTRWAQTNLTATQRYWVLWGFLAGFAVKVPLFPLHTWLPLAHTEAPTAGSVILAGVLLKLGTYGILRIAVPVGLMNLDGVVFHGLIIALAMLCLVGIIYGALVAWVQQDIKKLVAYSSVSHLGFCVLGILSFTQIGMQGSVLYMINHGLNTGAMFLVVGMIYDRFHTRDIKELSGLGRNMPVLAFFFVLFVLASIGLPGTNGFVSEFLTIQSAFISEYLGVWFGVIAATGVVLGAIYMLHMTACVIFGPLKLPAAGKHAGDEMPGGSGGHHDSHEAVVKNDIGPREIGLLTPIAVAVIVLGVLPTPVMKSMVAPLALLSSPLADDRPKVSGSVGMSTELRGMRADAGLPDRVVGASSD